MDTASLIAAAADVALLVDGDGVIGPTNADGSADNEIERQEALTIIGRQVGLIDSGVGTGNLAVALAAPASAGGLGVVVTGTALAGSTFVLTGTLPGLTREEATALIEAAGGKVETA